MSPKEFRFLDPLRVRWPGVPPRAADLPDSLQTYIDSRR